MTEKNINPQSLHLTRVPTLSLILAYSHMAIHDINNCRCNETSNCLCGLKFITKLSTLSDLVSLYPLSHPHPLVHSKNLSMMKKLTDEELSLIACADFLGLIAQLSYGSGSNKCENSSILIRILSHFANMSFCLSSNANIDEMKIGTKKQKKTTKKRNAKDAELESDLNANCEEYVDDLGVEQLIESSKNRKSRKVKNNANAADPLYVQTRHEHLKRFVSLSKLKIATFDERSFHDCDGDGDGYNYSSLKYSWSLLLASGILVQRSKENQQANSFSLSASKITLRSAEEGNFIFQVQSKFPALFKKILFYL